jgi:hypothetical protein
MAIIDFEGKINAVNKAGFPAYFSWKGCAMLHPSCFYTWLNI